MDIWLRADILNVTILKIIKKSTLEFIGMNKHRVN